MRTPEGFLLTSFAVGTKHSRCFSLDTIKGLVVDYILGESGQKGSPLTKDHYGHVRTRDDGVELIGDNNRRTLAITRDAIVAKEASNQQESIINPLDTLNLAKYIYPEVYEMMKTTRMRLIGYVWEFSQLNTPARGRFNSPSATQLSNDILKLTFDASEHPSEFMTRFVYRVKMSKYYSYNKKINDYINILITIRDNPVSGVWKTERNDYTETYLDEPRVQVITIDVQRILDPGRTIKQDIYTDHYQICENQISVRIKSILGDLGIG